MAPKLFFGVSGLYLHKFAGICPLLLLLTVAKWLIEDVKLFYLVRLETGYARLHESMVGSCVFGARQ